MTDELLCIDSVCAGEAPMTLVVEWVGGGCDVIDLADVIASTLAFEPLKDTEFFAMVKPVGYSSGIAWTDDLDISDSYPQTLAEEQRCESSCRS
jgi:hypothetical protein